MSRHSLKSRCAAIRRSVDALVPGRKRRFPAELRARIGAYARERIAEGASRARVGEEIGVSDPTLVRLLRDGPAPLRRVRIVDEVETALAPPSTIVVRAPGGIVVEGLEVTDIAELVRQLS